MNLEELSKTYPISKSVFHLFERVVAITGKPIEIELKEDLLAHALLKAARSHMNSHIIYVREDKLDCINHLLAHECYHLFRFWSVEKEDRKILSTINESDQRRTDKWRQELGSKGNRYPEQVFTMWNKGLLTFLYNAVTDTRIELSMANEYPELSEVQKKNLESLESDAKESMSKTVEKMIPSSLFLKTGAMQYAFLSRLTPIIGKKWKKSFKGKTEITTLGNKLLRQIPEEDGGLMQDIDIINKWSRLLELDGIQWLDFEHVPSGYAHQV